MNVHCIYILPFPLAALTINYRQMVSHPIGRPIKVKANVNFAEIKNASNATKVAIMPTADAAKLQEAVFTVIARFMESLQISNFNYEGIAYVDTNSNSYTVTGRALITFFGYEDIDIMPEFTVSVPRE